MRRHIWVCLMIPILLDCGGVADNLPDILDLNQWRFRAVNDSVWTEAQVPGTITRDLFLNGMIPDPYVADNALKMQWISKADWDYETAFVVSDTVLNKPFHQLQFEGIDTYADVYLNDQLILQADNAFRKWTVDVSKILKPHNVIHVKIKNHHDIENDLKETEPFVPPADDMADDKQRRVYTRRAQYQYGWDWAPRLITPGIWRPARLISWDVAKIKHSSVALLNLNDDLAQLSLQLTLEQKSQLSLIGEVLVNGEVVQTQAINSNTLESNIPFEIDTPKKWWPHNMGDPYLYDICVRLKTDSTLIEEVCFQKGLRTIELVNELDDSGESFYFKVNGFPVFMKGANYVPQDALSNTGSIENYQTIVQNAIEGNMNTLRVWGGGVYESDYFYTLCDQKGLMVWQDFMFACAMYPGSERFLRQVKEEAEDNVRRIGGHASVVLWCGNNESSEGWANWGWKSGKNEAQIAEIWDAYQKVFGQILPQAVSDFGQGVPYWESSPKYGRGNPKFSSEGDAHDWFVWHDAYPFEHFEQNVPRFMSEYGFQSLPSSAVVEYVNEGNDDLNTDGFGSHQKHPRGTELIQAYMKRDFPEPRNDQERIYLSQLTQAYGISKAIVAHRSSRPYTMGSLYWQFNDCWPSVSWSSVDYLGQWKALHHAVKHDFDNLLIAATVTHDKLSIQLINDNLAPTTGRLSVTLMQFDGTILISENFNVTAKANASSQVAEIFINVKDFNAQNTLAVLQFQDKQTLVYFDRPKNLDLMAGAIGVKTSPTEGGFEVLLTSDVLQKNVFIGTSHTSSVFPNFVDILPNQPKKIFISTGRATAPELKLLSLNQF